MFNKKPGLGLFVFGLLWIGAIVLFRIGPTYVSSGWPTVIGTVVGSHVGSSSNGEGTTFSPVIAYTYEVMGIEYSSSKVWAGSTPSTSDYS